LPRSPRAEMADTPLHATPRCARSGALHINPDLHEKTVNTAGFRLRAPREKPRDDARTSRDDGVPDRAERHLEKKRSSPELYARRSLDVPCYSQLYDRCGRVDRRAASR